MMAMIMAKRNQMKKGGPAPPKPAAPKPPPPKPVEQPKPPPVQAKD